MPLPLLLQLVGVLAVLAGLTLLLPPGWAVLAAGGVLTVVGIALEVARTPRRPTTPAESRS